MDIRLRRGMAKIMDLVSIFQQVINVWEDHNAVRDPRKLYVVIRTFSSAVENRSVSADLLEKRPTYFMES